MRPTPRIRRFGAEARVTVRRPGAVGLTTAMIQLGRGELRSLGEAAARRRFGADVLLSAHSPTVVALHFAPGGAMDEHVADYDVLFIVTAGGGMVRVGGSDALAVSVEPGDAVLWPAHEAHVAWAGQDGMDAVVVEFTP